MFLSLKISETAEKEESVFTLATRTDNQPLFQVTLNNRLKLLRVHYLSSSKLETVDFLTPKLFDGQWHTLMLTVELNWVKVTIDCQGQDSVYVSRSLAADLRVRNAVLLVGNDGRKKSTIFSVKNIFYFCFHQKLVNYFYSLLFVQGWVKQMIYLPRAELSTLVCPGNDRHNVTRRMLNLGSVLRTTSLTFDPKMPSDGVLGKYKYTFIIHGHVLTDDSRDILLF